MSLIDLTAAELLSELNAGRVASAEVTRAFLDQIDRVDGQVRAFLQVDRQGALEQAEQIDRRRKAGQAVGRLGGLPVAIKDVLCTRGEVDHLRFADAGGLSGRRTTPRPWPSSRRPTP